MSGKSSIKSTPTEEWFNEAETTELMSNLFQVVFDEGIEDKEKESILKDLLQDGKKVQKENVDKLQALYSNKVAADHLRDSATIMWKEAEDHRSTSTLELTKLKEEAQGYVDQKKENAGQIESKYKQLIYGLLQQKERELEENETECEIPKELSMKITELTGYINTNVAIADGAFSSLNVAENNYQRAKATHESTMENLNTRNFFSGGWQDVVPMLRYGAKVDHRMFVDALNRSAESVHHNLLSTALVQSGHLYDPLIRVIMNLTKRKLNNLFQCLRNISFDLNPAIVDTKFHDRFCFATRRSSKSTIEDTFNRRARLIYFLVPNPPCWIVRGSGDDERFKIDRSASLASSKYLDEDYAFGDAEAMLQEAQKSIEMGSAKKRRRLEGPDDTASPSNDQFLERLNRELSPGEKEALNGFVFSPYSTPKK